ncbi:FHA domain-containing protein [Stenotrophomonas sp. MMGLT7]|uniref:FHA domain-containing protein n=1 Tax=Stenotrophomonas sp. MMGLT7 TaxID=2901227 RepID=UPI001E35B897|nr:FHA domain-containing protein [Stenotrophomonas sp. MMGLT7]
MRELQIHFSNRQQPDRSLQPGLHRITRHATGVVRLGEEAPGALLLAQFCLDQRGLWLQVANGSRGIHVNGRPVRRMALLRAGDAVYADGVEMVIRSACTPVERMPDADEAANDGTIHTLLRGLGGLHHGRSFTLDRPRIVGRGREADIRVDDPSFAERHARLECHGERVLLRDLGSAEGSLVNGVPVRDCWLQPGDQVVFDAQRFVLEVPLVPHDAAADAGAAPAVATEPDPAPRQEIAATARRWPWLLLSALLLAAAISGLLWFGAR